MSVYTTLDCKVTMDPAAFARFCETRSIDWCAPACGQKPSRWSGWLTVNADSDKIMLECPEQTMRNLRILPDLHKAAQAGQVNGAYTSACVDGDTSLEAVVFRNSEIWAGWAECLNDPVDIGPCTSYMLGNDADPIEIFHRVEDSDTKHRVVRYAALDQCCCGGVTEDGQPICSNDGKRHENDGVPLIDISTFMPASAYGQLEQALIDATGAVNIDGLLAIGRLAWHANGPGQQNMFRRWLETFKEATGERSVTWRPDMFDEDWRIRLAGAVGKLHFRPICADTGGTQRGSCPAFLIGHGTDTIRVPAHVDNASLADAAKLAAGGADPAEAVAVIAAITDPDRR